VKTFRISYIRFILVEIGTFTGYTSLAIALALPADGELITCDISDEYVRQDIWVKAGVRNRINLQIRPALETLKDLLEKYGANSFDFIFIDADKENYPQYYELSVQLIRPNGLIAIDNTLWNGRVLNENDTSIETVSIRQTNELVKNDKRVDISFLRLGDGTTLCRKK
jgi:predicted O-methyltransferase YrrM